MTHEWQFGGWTFRPDTHELCKGKQQRLLEPRVACLLDFLLQHPDEVLTRDALIAAVWDRQVVSDDAVRRAVSVLRRTLASDGSGGYITTVHKRGYLASFPPTARHLRSAGVPVTRHAQTTLQRLIWSLPALGLALLSLGFAGIALMS